MRKEQLYFIGIAVVLLIIFASQIIPVLVTSFTDNPPLFWWAVIGFPSTFLLAEFVSGKYLSKSNSLTVKFLEKYLHVLLLFFSFIGFLIYTEILNKT